LAKFEKGHKPLVFGGKREGAGRPSAKELRETIKACDKARRRLEENVDKIMGSYLRFVHDDPATARHAVDKILPDEQFQPIIDAPSIHFIQFNHNPTQLSAEGLSGAVLVSNGNGHQERGEGVASEERQGQNRPEFHSFAHVSRKRG